MQDTGVVAHIGQGRRGLGQANQISVAADLHQPRIGLHRRMQRQRREHHAATLMALRHRLEQALMQRIVKMFRLHMRGDGFQGAVVHQNRAEQCLLDFDVVGDVTIDFLFHHCSAGSRGDESTSEAHWTAR